VTTVSAKGPTASTGSVLQKNLDLVGVVVRVLNPAGEHVVDYQALFLRGAYFHQMKTAMACAEFFTLPGRKEERMYAGRGNSPCIYQGKDTHWLRRAVSPPSQSRNRSGWWGSVGLLEAPGSSTWL